MASEAEHGGYCAACEAEQEGHGEHQVYIDLLCPQAVLTESSSASTTNVHLYLSAARNTIPSSLLKVKPRDLFPLILNVALGSHI